MSEKMSEKEKKATVKKTTVKKIAKATVSKKDTKTTKKTKTTKTTKAKKASPKITKKDTKTTTAKKTKTTGAKKTVAKKVIKPENKVTKKTAKQIKKVNIFIKLLHNLNFIKSLFIDVSLLYKNIFHWIISKIIIFIWSIILATISVLPLVIILIIYSFYSDLTIAMIIDGIFSRILFENLFGNILLLLIITVSLIMYSYSNILLMRVNDSYLNKKNLPYKKNDYFNVKKICKFFNLTLLNLIILLMPFLVLVILISALFIFSGDVDNIESIINSGLFNYFSVLSLLFFIILGLLLVYLFYRIVFSFFLLADIKNYNDEKSVFTYIKESFNKTKKIKIMLKFIVIITIFIVLMSPINYLGKVIENNKKILNNYIIYLSLNEEQKSNLNSNELYYYEQLKISFNGITEEEVNAKIKLNYIYIMLFKVFHFIFLSGLFVMIFSSFYKRELK